MNVSTFFHSKGFRRAALASVVAMGAFGASQAFAAAQSDSSTTSATVVEPITIVSAQDLAFGQFSAGTGGTVVLTTAGAVSPTADVVITGGTSTAAQFTVNGQTDAAFSIAVTDNDLTFNDGTSDHVMTFAPTHDLNGTAGDNPASGTLTGGTQTIYVGGTLTVGDAQAPGLYAGTVTAEVNYE